MSEALIDIIDLAILDVGHDTIGSLDGDDTTTEIANKYHLKALDIVLSRWDWNFARERKVPTIDTQAAPLFGFVNAYSFPNTPYLVKVRQVLQGGFALGKDEYRIEKRHIHTNASPIQVIYTARVTNPNNFCVGFSLAYQNKLSELFAMPMTRKLTLKREMQKEYILNVGVAIAENESENPEETTQFDGITSVLEE